MEGKILGAEDRSIQLEYELFLKVREEVLTWLRPLQDTAAALAQLECSAASPRRPDFGITAVPA